MKVCTVLSSAQCMAKDVGKGSDMQGTPPRDLRVFRNLIASVYAAIYRCTVWVVCMCSTLVQITKEDVTWNRHINPRK